MVHDYYRGTVVVVALAAASAAAATGRYSWLNAEHALHDCDQTFAALQLCASHWKMRHVAVVFLVQHALVYFLLHQEVLQVLNVFLQLNVTYSTCSNVRTLLWKAQATMLYHVQTFVWCTRHRLVGVSLLSMT